MGAGPPAGPRAACKKVCWIAPGKGAAAAAARMTGAISRLAVGPQDGSSPDNPIHILNVWKPLFVALSLLCLQDGYATIMVAQLKRVLALAAVALLAGCGHALTLMSDNGAMGTGRAIGFGGKGTLEVQLGSKTYTGTWVAATGGSVGFGSFGRTTFNSTTVDASSSGNAMLAAADGSTLRCRFVYGGMSGAGHGECLDSTGRHYDMQIS